MTQNTHVNSEPAGSAAPGTAHQNTNGEAPPKTTKTNDEIKDQAEEIVDNIAGKVAAGAYLVTYQVLRFASRAREMSEDFWAEVQNFRKGKRS